MDKLVASLCIFLSCLTASAETFLTRTNVVRNVPIDDTSIVGTTIAYNPSNGLHVAYYTNAFTTTNLIFWTDGSWISNKLITNFTALNGLALRTDSIFGINTVSKTLLESTWPGGVPVTNIAITNAEGLFHTPTGGVVAVGRMIGTINYFYRWTNGVWSQSNILVRASLPIGGSSYSGLGPDRKIYTFLIEDAGHGNDFNLVRMLETNSILENTDLVLDYTLQTGEMPRIAWTADKVKNRMLYATIRGQYLFGAMPCIQIAGTLAVWAISNNLSSNIVVDLPQSYFVERVLESGIAIPGTNTLLHFGQAYVATNGCNTVPLYSSFTYATSNITTMGQIKIMARSEDNWILYKGYFGEWKLEKLNPP